MMVVAQSVFHGPNGADDIRAYPPALGARLG
jgi:hypothetical protein